jgi:predicted nucleic acid-binding protein
MRLLDSNIIIYATKPGHEFLQTIIAAPDICTSAVSYVEVLGFHQLSASESELLEEFFASIPTLPLSPIVLDEAVSLRRQRKMRLGDALVAATAIAHGCELITRNVSDFNWITGLVVTDPFPAAK